MKNKNGITLIALVITIIILLILAGVSIAMLIGQNGILTQAQNAKNATEQASVREKIDLSIVGARAQTTNGKLTEENLKSELSNYDIIPKNTKFPLEIEKDGQKLTINSNGNILSYKEMGEITGQETENTSTKDSLGNYMVVPAGFKIINLNDDVTAGIVIEDVSHEGTSGSQFVWIPVGDVIKDNQRNIGSIKLSRYIFADDNVGTPSDQNSNLIDVYDVSYTEDTVANHDNSRGNIIAKDIEDFKTKVTNNQGYYIGRYEARKNGEKVTEKGDDEVYNCVTQSEAATNSRTMYSDNNFESDLINSYAWDTMVLFLQKFDNRTNKESLKPYARQGSLNDDFADHGTNNLEASKQDIVCNIYDIASNCFEWTTETSSDLTHPCTDRGGVYELINTYSSYRNYGYNSSNGPGDSFRVLLYM